MGIFLFLILTPFLTNSISISLNPLTGTPPSYRELPGLCLDSSSNKLYTYGGRYESLLDDMWEFDLSSNKWEQIFYTSTQSPGARSDPYLVFLPGSNKILLFGGDTAGGPVSDLWEFNIKNQSVRDIQWKLVHEQGEAPPRAYYKCVTDYEYEGRRYLAVYGGVGHKHQENSLYM